MSLPADYPRCKTCKWWDKESESIISIRSERWANCYKSVSGTPEASFIYDDGYPHIMCGPDFGCVHWEAKDA